MYAPTQIGQVAAQTATAHLSAYRRTLIELLGEAKVITIEEYELATSRIMACQSLPTLQKWYRNCIREIARREDAQLLPTVEYATAEQKQEVIKLANSVYITRAEKTKALLNLPHLDNAGVIGLIGGLWDSILHRQEQAAEGSTTAALSFSDAC